MSWSVASVRDATSKQLDSRPQPDEVVTNEDVADAPKLARLLTRILSELAALRRAWSPRVITFRDIVSTGTNVSPQTVRLTHGFGSAVEYEVVDIANPGVVNVTLVSRDSTSDANVLVVKVYFAATIAIRVTEAG